MLFNKDNRNIKNDNLIKVSALLIHAAKIDENYSLDEEKIIKETLLEIGANNENIDKIIEDGKKIEADSNQILEFTKEVKNKSIEEKKTVVEALWNIIYSDENADMYETNLMRRISGLLYLDPKVVGDIKEKVSQKKHDIFGK